MKIENCPFCGSDEVQTATHGSYWVLCRTCCSNGPSSRTENGAIERWNGAYISMNLRDEFAKAALAGTLTDNMRWTDQYLHISKAIAEAAYALADAMLEARKGGGNG